MCLENDEHGIDLCIIHRLARSNCKLLLNNQQMVKEKQILMQYQMQKFIIIVDLICTKILNDTVTPIGLSTRLQMGIDV